MIPSAREPPEARRFYTIKDNQDGTLDVYLTPDGTGEGRVLVVRGVQAFERIEDDIRARYQAWCASGEIIR